MLIARKSPLTHRTNVREINVTFQQLSAWRFARIPIQNIMPHVSPEDRKFILTGLTPEDWAVMFPPEDKS